VLPSRAAPTDTVFYLDSGDSGPDDDDEVRAGALPGQACWADWSRVQVQTQTVLAHMESAGLVLDDTVHYYLARGAQHSETYWGRRFWSPMLSLYTAPGHQNPL
jgi:hypothetical protein